MKSYFLEGTGDIADVRGALSALLPGQADPWLLHAALDDVLAYLDVTANETGAWSIQADVSGRHYDCDNMVLNVLRKLQRQLGGLVRDDDGNDR
jgi:hypothetical protein